MGNSQMFPSRSRGVSEEKRALHKTKQKKDFILKYKRYAKGKYVSPTGTSSTNKETNDQGLTNTQSARK